VISVFRAAVTGEKFDDGYSAVHNRLSYTIYDTYYNNGNDIMSCGRKHCCSHSYGRNYSRDCRRTHKRACVKRENCRNFCRVTPLNRKWMTEAVIARLSNYRVRRASPAPLDSPEHKEPRGEKRLSFPCVSVCI